MMQALATRWDRPCIELLKITAVGTNTIVAVSDVMDLREEMFETDQREALAVYSEGYMRSLIASPDRMDAVLKLLRSFSPRIMVVSELEANFNSLTFSQRFVEALFSFAAMFDCLDLSAVVLYQAKLVLNRFACGEFCRVDVDGRSLIVGWKDTPFLSISSWKFARLRKLKDDDAFE
ncbi:DELLA protein RGL1 [Linum grandiflorum]